MSLKAKIEAVLFLTAKPIKAQAIARIVNADVQAVRQALLELVHEYEERQGGLEIADEDGYSFQVRDAYASLMDEFLPIEMSAALIRTLSAIAIKQPIPQSEIIRVRGAGAYDHIRELVNRELVAKKEGEGGRSPTLSTTKKFQEYFRLTKDGKELRNFLKHQVRKADAAGGALQPGQLQIPEVVTNEAELELNNRIFLETADSEGGEAAIDMNVPAEELESAQVDAAHDMAGNDVTENDVVPALDGAAPAQVEAEVETVSAVDMSPEHADEAFAVDMTPQEVPGAVTVVEAVEAADTDTTETAPAKPAKPAAKARRAKPSATLSKLAAVAEEALEPAALPVTVQSEEGEEESVSPAADAAATAKSSVQAHSPSAGPALGNTPKKKRTSGLAELLKKQRELEQALDRAHELQAEQTTLSLNVDQTPPDKTLPS